MKPGLTGLWQLSGDRAFLIHENVEYDLYYIQHRNFFMDLAILLEEQGRVLLPGPFFSTAVSSASTAACGESNVFAVVVPLAFVSAADAPAIQTGHATTHAQSATIDNVRLLTLIFVLRF